ncbi:dTDP-4-dehydrorhamnose reductase [Calditrichota bacterium]
MKILITGANGLLGQKLQTVLTGEIYDLYCTDLQDSSVLQQDSPYYKLNLIDKSSTTDLIESLSPDIIIHTAAMTDVDGCELNKEDCWKINVGTTENIVNVAVKTESKLIFMSTDYIFDGEMGPYNEDALPSPISYYGRSKLAAENSIRGSELEWCILRTIILYGTGVNIKSSFVSWLLSQLRQNKAVRIVNDQWGNTTLVDDLALAIDRIIILEKTGIFNAAGMGYMSRYEFAQEIAAYFELDGSLISAISTEQLGQPAKRPLKSGLITTKAERELFLAFRTVNESLRVYKEQEKHFTVI